MYATRIAYDAFHFMIRYVNGEISLPAMLEGIDARLFELRQDPKMNSEKALLSQIELYGHEASENFRDEGEVRLLASALVEFAQDVNISSTSGMVRQAAEIKADGPGLGLSIQSRSTENSGGPVSPTQSLIPVSS